MKKNTRKIVAERLSGLMKTFPQLNTQPKLAKRSGVGQTTIGRILRGEVDANSKTLEALATPFGVPIGYLYGDGNETGQTPGQFKLVEEKIGEGTEGGHLKQSPNYYNVEAAQTAGRLPLISWIQAGEWGEIVDNFQPGDAEDWIPCPFSHGPNAFILRVAGFSMYNPGGDKSYSPGEFIAVDPRIEPQNKKMVVAKIDEEETATFKQLLIDEDGTYLLQALNPAWPTRIMPMPPGSRIVGVVIGKWVPE